MLTFNPATCAVNRRVERETLYIGRGSIWGNPFTSIQNRQTKAEFIVATREESVLAYKDYILKSPVPLHRLLELNGHKLGCFCKPQSCHGDILVYLLKGMIWMLRDLRVPDGAIDWADPNRIKQLVWYSDFMDAACGPPAPCWRNPETGYSEYCPKHEAIIADIARSLDAIRQEEKACA